MKRVKKFKKAICVVLSAIIMLLSCGISAGATSVDNVEEEEVQVGENMEKVDELCDERTDAYLRGDTERAEEITKELNNYGVEQLTYNELCALLDVPVPLYEIEYDNYIYERYSEDFMYEGEGHTYMVIIVTPTNTNCNLWINGSFTEYNPNYVEAGALTLLDIATTMLVGKLEEIEEIYETKTIKKIVTAYDVLSTFYDNFNSDTAITNIEAVYTWSFAETCSFHYMPSAIGTSGWSLIGRYNKVSGVISTSIPGLTYDSGSGEAKGTVDVYNEDIYIRADDFDSGYKTYVNFRSNGGATVENITQYIEIKGVEGKTVYKAKFKNPLYPNEVR